MPVVAFMRLDRQFELTDQEPVRFDLFVREALARQLAIPVALPEAPTPRSPWTGNPADRQRK